MRSSDAIEIVKSLATPASLADLIARHYGLSDVHCQLIKSTMRDTYLIVSRERRAVAAIYRHGARTLDEIHAEIELLNFLSSYDFPAPLAIKTLSGDRTIAIEFPEGLRHLVLMAFVDGTTIRRPAPPEEAELVGRLLVRFHSATDRLSLPLARPQLGVSWMIDEPLAAVLHVLGADHPQTSELLELAEWSKDLLRQLPTDLLGFGLIHGDIIPSNILRMGNGDLTLIDFDMSGYGWRAFDIATYLHEIEFWDAPQDAAEAFLSAYQDRRPLAEWELSALGALQVARSILALGIPAEHVDEWGRSSLSDSLVDRMISLMHRAKNRGSPFDPSDVS